jgi:hypothetical protein
VVFDPDAQRLRAPNFADITASRFAFAQFIDEWWVSR